MSVHRGSAFDEEVSTHFSLLIAEFCLGAPSLLSVSAQKNEKLFHLLSKVHQILMREKHLIL